MKKTLLVFTLLMMFSVLKSSAQNSTCATAATLTVGGTMCSGTSGGSNSGDPTGNDDTDGNVCSSNYSGGDDFIFEYTATTTDALKLDLFATNSWTGLLVTAGCPTTGTCFASSTSSSANESLTTPAMTIGQVYYIHISTWPSPQSAGQFCLDAVLQTPPMPPANDDCADAEPLTVNADLNCTATTSGTILLASASGEDETTCGGTEDDDVWYSFVATATSHKIDLINVANGTTDLYHSVWSGTCGALTNILCSDPNSSTASGLTIGETYLLRVYSWTSTPGQTTTFDVCIGTLPPPPANDDCADAEPLTVNADLNCTATTSGTIASATASGEDETTCFGTEDDDVWYSFVATATSHEIDLINVANGTTDLYHSVWSGTCGSLTNILCSDPNSSTASGLTIGETYLLRVYSWTSTPGQTTTFDVCIGTLPPPPVNDDCGNAISITAGGTATGSTASASNIENLSPCSGGGNGGFCSGGGTGFIDFGAGVWYVYTSSVSGETITASTDNPGTDFDTEIQIFEGSCGALTCVGGDDDGGSVNLGTSSVLCWVSTGTPTQPVTYYIYIDGHGSSTGNFELTLTAESAAAFTAPADLCLNAGVQTGLGGGTSVGGVYSGPGVTDDGNGLTYSFDPAVAGVGVHTLTYTISPTNFASDDVEVFAVPTVAFTALADLCENAGVQTGLSGGTPVAGTMEAGVYSGPGVTDDGNGMTYSFDPATAGVGTHTITYTFTNASGCVDTATDDVEVFAVPVVSFTALGDLSIAAGVQTGQGGGSPTGGVYSGPGVTDDGNGMTYSFDPSAAGSGVHTLTYSFTNSNGCTGSADDDVEVFGLFQITCPADLVIPECTSSADSAILVQDFLNSFSFTGGTNASAAFDPFTVAAMCVGGQTVVTYVVTDDTGSDFCIRNIFVNADMTAPTFTTACPADISVECDQPVPAAATLEATDNCQPTPAPAIFINEIHYDNAGGDVGEFVEVAGSAGLDLTGYSVVLYNGSNGTAYNTINLSGTIDDEGTGFGALEFFQSGIQNGAPDGLALVDAGGNVLEFLNYEGSTITATNGPASGMTSINIGVSEPGSTPVGESLQRTGTGGVGSDFTWTGPLANSAGSLNAGQTVVVAPPPPIPVVFEETFVAGCGITGVITRTWTATDACGNEEVCTQIVTIQDTTDPTFIGTLPADVTIECDESAPAPEMLMAMDNCPSVSTMVTFINEIHYDNSGGDVGEFFEIAGSAGLDLSGYQVALYNGSNGGVYNTINLTGVIPDEGTGFGAIDFQLPANGLQNGSPDGLALVDAGGMVIEFLSYEGTITASGGPAVGLTSTDIGVVETGGALIGESLQRTGMGGMGSDFTWVGPLTETPGLLNVGQSVMANLAPIAVTFSENFVAGGCGSTGVITRTYTATDACGNEVEHIQTITVEDNTPPSFLGTLPMDITVECDDIPAPANLSAVDNCGAGLMVWINEFHYDNTGGDVGEFIEVAGFAGTDLSGYTLVLYNGNNGFSYNTLTLSGTIPDEGAGFGAVSFSLPLNGLQNGAPDGIALAQGITALQFISYEGSFVAMNGPAGGMTSMDIGVSEPGGTPVGQSLQLIGTGSTYADFTWTGPVAESPGLLNVDQNAEGNITPVFEETTIAGSCAGESTITRTWTATDACGNAMIHVQTITVEDNTGPNAVCQNLTIELDEDGNASITADQIDNGSSDLCSGVANLSLDVTDFTCADVGDNTVTLSVTDNCGNISTCTATVTVEDNIPPVVTCPDNIYVHLDPGACDAIVTWNPATATDACGIATVEQTGGPVSGTTFDRNTTTTISYEVTDVNGNTASCSFTIQIIEFVPDSDYITCNNLVNITLDENCEATVGADQILEGNNYGCYDDYIVTFADTGLPVVLDGSHIGNTYEVMVVGPAGVPCWGSIFVEDKLIPDLVCTDVTVRCDDDTTPGAGYVSVSDMVAPTMSVDNATVSETVTFGAENSDVVDVNVVVTSNHTWVGDLVISITSPSGTTVELMNNIGGPGFGCAGDGLDLVFDDAATLTYADLDGTCNNNPAAEGTFQPLEALSAFNGEPAAGDWTVSVTDLATGDSGDVDITINLSANSTIPFPVPATATIIPQGNNTYTVLDFDPCGPATLIYSDVESGELCDGDRNITREWIVTDESGNTTSCTQTISITPTTVADVAADIPEDVTIDCGDALPPVLTEIGCSNIGIGLDGEPTIIDVCDGSYKLLREYILVNWCDNSTLEFTQIIKVLDTTAPSITCPADITISTNSNDCLGAIQLPIATATDECSSDITVSVSNVSSGDYNPSINAVSGLEVGTHTVTYTATDGCGNESSCDMMITVEDQVAPIAICDEHTVLGIGSDGTAFIDATTFDDGSSDNCGIVEMTARRMDNPACPGFDGTDFLPSVPFYCCDVNTTVMVEFRVRDAAGNVNSCMVEVDVEDKIDPTISCPADQDVECSATYLDYIEVGQPLPADAIAANGEAVASDNCPGVTVTNNVISNTIDCGTGIITIVWTATDAGGRTTSCIQRYFIDNSDPFNIVDTEHRNYLPLDQLGPNGEFHTLTDGVEWPVDYETTTCGTGLEPEDLSSPYDYPIIYEGACNNIAVGHHDQVLDFGAADACLKILRKWYVVDWCQAVSNQDPTQPGPGVWHYTQIIKVINSSAPTISCEPDNGVDMYPNYDEDCGPTFVPLVAVAQDDCTPSNLLEFTWALSDGQTGVGNDASQELNNGDYTITFTVTDLCGNTSECTRSFTVFDAKKPTPVCIFGIATTVMPSSGAVTIWASDFESGSSYDNCTAYEDLQFSFSQDVTIDNIIISCDDIPADGLVPVSIYVTDEAGNFDFCSTFINVQDPTGVCVGPASTIKGSIETEDQEMVEDVNVNLTDNNGLNIPVTTGANGTYEFNMMPGDQEVTPIKDINYLNGVTTYDLVLISKHILGTDLLDSPYKVIAADANNSQTVTTLDIVKLRALILYIDDELAGNNSWRFVDHNYIFPNPINPWQEDFPEYIAIDGSFDPANFIGIKVGDVNGTASPNSLLGSDTRTFDGTLALRVDAKKVEEGETFTVDFRARDFKNISGYQFTFGFDQNVVEFVDVVSNLENLGTNNFGLTKLKDGVITTSWNNSKGISVEDNSILFSMKFVANNTITTNEIFKINSQFTASEAYNENDLYEVVLAYNGNEISNEFELFQNSPNPFKSETTISFNMPEAEEVTLKIYDISGRVLKLQKMNATKGFNSIDIKRGELDGAGVLYYQLETATEIGVKKMILVN